MIKVNYLYQPKHNPNMIVCEKTFNNWQSALRFIKMVDGAKFAGHVLSWECEDPYDNEQLWRRHHLTPYLSAIDN